MARNDSTQSARELKWRYEVKQHERSCSFLFPISWLPLFFLVIYAPYLHVGSSFVVFLICVPYLSSLLEFLTAAYGGNVVGEGAVLRVICTSEACFSMMQEVDFFL